MKKSRYKKGMAFLLSCVLAFGTCVSVLDPSFSLRTFAYAEKQGTIIASSLNVRSGPGTGNASIARLANGTAVTVIGEDTAYSGTKSGLQEAGEPRRQDTYPATMSSWLPRILCRTAISRLI